MSDYLEAREDMEGRHFGHILVLWRTNTPDNHPPNKPWFCECDCGRAFFASRSELLNGKTISCGCITIPKEEKQKKKPITYVNGHPKRLFVIWCSMKQRCYNPKRKDYHSYGGRGITICDEWLDNFIEFEKWSLANGYDDTLSIDRIDNDGNYCPENCRWATRKEQDHNRPNVNLYYINGEEYTTFEICEKYRIDPKMLKRRLKRGLMIQDAIEDCMLARIKPWNAEEYRNKRNERKKRYVKRKKDRCVPVPPFS